MDYGSDGSAGGLTRLLRPCFGMVDIQPSGLACIKMQSIDPQYSSKKHNCLTLNSALHTDLFQQPKYIYSILQYRSDSYPPQVILAKTRIADWPMVLHEPLQLIRILPLQHMDLEQLMF